jgi:hypothetical protein
MAAMRTGSPRISPSKLMGRSKTSLSGKRESLVAHHDLAFGIAHGEEGGVGMVAAQDLLGLLGQLGGGALLAMRTWAYRPQVESIRFWSKACWAGSQASQ